VSDTLARARARVARTSRAHGPDHPATRAAKSDYYAEKLAEHIKAIVDSAPPLTAAQRDHLAALLRGSAKGAAA
jgi:hypothetical protein